MPRNIGIAFEKYDCLRVRSVDPRGPAAKAGIRAGDLLGAAAGRRLFSHTDLRGVLHRLPRKADRIRIHWTREGKLMEGDLELRPGWRRTPVAWRPSFAWGNVGAHPGFDRAGEVSDKERARMGIGPDEMAVRPIFTAQDPTYVQRAGLLESHTIVAVNGKSPNFAGRAFMAWFRLQFDPGDDVRLSVREGLKPDVTYVTFKSRAFAR